MTLPKIADIKKCFRALISSDIDVLSRFAQLIAFEERLNYLSLNNGLYGRDCSSFSAKVRRYREEMARKHDFLESFCDLYMSARDGERLELLEQAVFGDKEDLLRIINDAALEMRRAEALKRNQRDAEVEYKKMLASRIDALKKKRLEENAEQELERMFAAERKVELRRNSIQIYEMEDSQRAEALRNAGQDLMQDYNNYCELKKRQNDVSKGDGCYSIRSCQACGRPYHYCICWK
jgi:hypothetical protein